MEKKYLVIRMVLLFTLALCLVLFIGTVLFPANRKLALVPIPTLPDNLDEYLAQTESLKAPKKDTEKRIEWFYPDQRQTDVSIVYLHGFSASRKEISPVSEKIAKALHANIFLTRLEGHGYEVGPSADKEFSQARAEDWIRDANEALAIGRRIGRKVILIGCSTGASLAIHLAQKNPKDIQALVFLSPNFRPHVAISWLSSGPLGKLVARLIVGKNLTWIPTNQQQGYYWTHSYPSSAIYELMELLKYVQTIDLVKVKVPLLMMYTHSDKVVSVEKMLQKFPEFGSTKKALIESKSPNHVMAGDILSPAWTQPTVDEILKFISELD